jgi:hypothetical protein
VIADGDTNVNVTHPEEFYGSDSVLKIYEPVYKIPTLFLFRRFIIVNENLRNVDIKCSVAVSEMTENYVERISVKRRLEKDAIL